MAILQKGKGQDWVNESLLPALKNRAEKSLLLALIPDLLDRKEIPDIEAITKTVFWGTIDQLKIDDSDLERHFKYPYEVGHVKPHWRANYESYEKTQVSRFMALAKKLGLHGLSDEADRLIDNCCGSVAETHRPKPVQLQTDTGMRGGLHVRDKPHLLAEFILADFVDVVEQTGRPAPASLKPFFESLVRHYVHSELPPWLKKPVGWAHNVRQCGSSSGQFFGRDPERCRESGPCKELYNFLRGHLNGGLPGDRFRCKEADKDKDGATPAALVETKLGNEYTLDPDIHKKYIVNLENRLLAFRTSFVRAALGDALYEELVLLGGIRKPPPGEDKDETVPLSCEDPAACPSVPVQGSERKKRAASGSFEQPTCSKERRRGRSMK
ncbi:uncharacterized protein PG986_004542 [Apiospora aurea]|uniref:Uncharacterized protein n=1 Tax=Apiospora aurea TaxID=335848 RepID=A0ABR1QMV9_9PEZI